MNKAVVAKNQQATLFIEGQVKAGSRIYLDAGKFELFGVVTSVVEGSELRIKLAEVSLVADNLASHST